MNKIDLIVDALENAVHNFAGDDTESKCVEALAAARELQAELAMLKMPTKIFGPNLVEILNAAGFYRREWVGLTDDEIWECQHLSGDFYRAIEAKLKEKNT